jgi:hypothetical protein
VRKFFEEISPLFAGMHLAGSLIGFFGIGAVSKWIIEHWLPLTRWFWGELFTLINFPEITTQDKDALTTLVFFAPMAVTSFISWWAKQYPPKHGVRGDNPENTAGKQLRLKIYAALFGTVFMVIVGGSVLQDGILLFTPEVTSEPRIVFEVFKIKTDRESLLYAVGGGLAGAVFYIYFFSNREAIISKEMLISNFELSREGKITGKKSDILNLMIDIQVWVIRCLYTIIMVITNLWVLASFLVFTIAFSGIALTAKQLGPLRTTAPLLVLISLCATVFLDPGRMLKTAGVVIALVFTSYVWDLAVFIVKEIENVPI